MKIDVGPFRVKEDEKVSLNDRPTHVEPLFPAKAEYAAALVGFGLPEAIAKAVASWDVDASNGALFDGGRQLSALIGRPTTPLSTAVADALAAVSKA